MEQLECPHQQLLFPHQLHLQQHQEEEEEEEDLRLLKYLWTFPRRSCLVQEAVTWWLTAAEPVQTEPGLLITA
jgi:hypothetical protein